LSPWIVSNGPSSHGMSLVRDFFDVFCAGKSFVSDLPRFPALQWKLAWTHLDWNEPHVDYNQEYGHPGLELSSAELTAITL
jgi:hypothetical protein